MKWSLIGSMIIGVLILFVLDLMLGSVHIPPDDILSILVGSGSGIDQIQESIILKIRLPKALTAVLAGAALSVGGLQMQTLFRNPLAGPSVLGITAGASLGVATVMLASGAVASTFAIKALGLGGGWLIVVAATLGAGVILLMILGLSVRIQDHVVLLIVGIMMGFVTTAVVSIWQYFSDPNQIQEYLIWTFGSLNGVTQTHLTVLSIVVVIGLLMAFLTSKSLNVLLLGETYARSMGVKIRQSRAWIILSTSLLAGAVTGFCGPIGFVGIAVPHLTRGILHSSDHRLLIPACCLIGAIVMLVCDMVAQLPGSPIALPINAVTALIGAPVVIGVIIRRRNLKASFS